VYHLAAQAGVRPSLEDPVRDASVNLMGTLNVLECARKVGARKVIYAASGGTVYGEPKRLPAKESSAQGSFPLSPYAISKKVVVDYLGYYQRYASLDFTACALANVYGPRQDPHGEAGVVAIFLGRLAHGEAPHIFGDGSQQRDYVYVGDVATVTVAALERPSGVFNIGTGVATSVLDLFEVCRRASGVDVEPVFDAPRLGELQRSVLDTGLAERELGFAARTSFDDGIASTWDFIRAEGERDRGAK